MSTDDPAQGSCLPEAIPSESAATVHRAAERSSYIVVWLAALAVGLGAWLAAELGIFHVEPEVEKITLIMGGEVISQSRRTRMIAARHEVSRSLMTFGGLLGLGMGLAGARSGRSWRRALVAGAIGGVTGATAGSLMPSIILPRSMGVSAREAADLTNPLLMHLGAWVPLGIAAGLAFGTGRTEPRRWGITLVGGALGAAMGALLYEVLDALHALLFPLAGTVELIPEAWKAHPAAMLLVALSTAAGILAAAKPFNHRPREVSHVAGEPLSSS